MLFADDARRARAQRGLARHRQADQRAFLRQRRARPSRQARAARRYRHRLRNRAREAKPRSGKTFVDHLTHLIVHGFLHLLGFDHEIDADAERDGGMERASSPGSASRIPIARHRCATHWNDMTTQTAAASARTEAPRGPACSIACARSSACGGASVRDDIEDALEDSSTPTPNSPPQERPMLKNVLGLHEVRVARHHGAARRHHRGRHRRDSRRGPRAVSHRRSFASAGRWRDARRSARHGAHPRFRRLSRRLRKPHGSRLRRPTRRETAPAPARKAHRQISVRWRDLSLPLSRPTSSGRCCSCRPRCPPSICS